MKRFLTLIITICMCCSFLPSFAVNAAEEGATGDFSENFDSYADYTAAEAGGWYRGTNNSDEQVSVIANPTEGGTNRSVLLMTSGAGTASIARSDIGIDLISQDYATIVFNFCAVNSAAKRVLTMTDDAGKSYQLLTVAADALIGADGKTELGVISGDCWYQIAVAVNSADSNAVLFLDGKKLGDALPLEGTPTQVSSLIFSQEGEAGNSAAAVIDDVRVYPAQQPDGQDIRYAKTAVTGIVLPVPAGSSDLPINLGSGEDGDVITYIKDDYDGYYTHPDWHGRDIPPDWYTGWNNNGRFQAYTFNDAHGETVHFSTTGSGQTPYVQRENIVDIVGKGDYVAQFDILMPDDNSARAFSIQDGGGTNRSVVRFKTDSSIMFDTANEATKIGNNSHKWMHFACVYHADTGRYDAYLDGALVIEDKAMSGTVQPGISRIKFDVTGDAKGASETYIDNFAVYSGTTPIDFDDIPEPTEDKFLNTIFDVDPKFDENIKDAVALKIGSQHAYVNNVKTKVDPGNPEVRPFEENGVTSVPVRFIAEAFGANVSYDEATEGVHISFNGAGPEINFRIGEDIAYVDGEEVQVTRVVSKEDRVFVPLRFIAEKLGKQVYYNENGVIIIGNTDTPFNLPDEQAKFTALSMPK